MIRRLFRDLRTLRHQDDGAVAVEFMLLAPMLFGLLFGIVVMGYFMGVSHSVQQLATGAARTSVAGLDQAEREDLANAYLSDASNRYPLLSQEAITPTLTFEQAADASITVEVSYAVDGTLIDVANAFLGLGITSIDRSAYLAY